VVSHHAAVEIRRPVDVVAAYVFDPTTMPHWSGVLYEIEPIMDITPRLGRQLRANLKVLGVCLTVEGELVDLDLERRAATVRIVPVSGDGSLEHRLRVDPSPAGAVVHFWNDIDPPRWLAATVSDALIEAFVGHTATFALANIRDILERHEEDAVRRLAAAAAVVDEPDRLRHDGAR
jgi:hypothetical protein